MSDETRTRATGVEEPSDEQARLARDGSTATAGAEASGAAQSAGGGSIRQASLWYDAWLELKHNPLFWVAALLIVLFAVMAIAPWLFTNTNPHVADLQHFQERPSRGHPFGYDIQGRDYYTRVIYGARASIAIGLLSTAAAATIAIVLGAIAGFYGGILDTLIARLSDVWFAIPTILGGIVLLSVLENRGIIQVSLVLIVLGWPTMLRLMRSSVLSTKEADYVEAARALGASDFRIIRRHILPNAIAPVIVYATITVGIIISAEAALTFLGVGLQLPAISWGYMLSEAQNYVLTAPHLLFFPGVMLSLTIFAFILMGDALRDALDPKLR